MSAKRESVHLDPRRQFVVDVVNMAVSVPQPDPEDRLRVLAAASRVITPIDPALARRFGKEGLRIELEAIQRGERPVESIIAAGEVKCETVTSLVASISPNRLDVAERTLAAAVDRCPKVVGPVQRLISDALAKRVAAPRLFLAVANRVGTGNEWTQKTFEQMSSVLPSPDRNGAARAPVFANAYSELASQLPDEMASKTGVRLLAWLAQINPGKQRNLAVSVTTSAMRERLGEDRYKRVLGEDAGALQVAQTARQAGETAVEKDESVSVLRAMASADSDRTVEIENLQPPKRAREAAAAGFAAGTKGNRELAGHYFDIAFRALEDVWSGRHEREDAPEIVEEVSEAAAQVDSADALQRAQAIQDPAAQAIGMIAVARVAANRD